MTDSGPRAILGTMSLRILHVPLNDYWLQRMPDSNRLWWGRFTIPTAWFRSPENDSTNRAVEAFRARCSLQNAPVRFATGRSPCGLVQKVTYSHTLETVAIRIVVTAGNKIEPLWGLGLLIDEKWRCIEVVLQHAPGGSIRDDVSWDAGNWSGGKARGASGTKTTWDSPDEAFDAKAFGAGYEFNGCLRCDNCGAFERDGTTWFNACATPDVTPGVMRNACTPCLARQLGWGSPPDTTLDRIDREFFMGLARPGGNGPPPHVVEEIDRKSMAGLVDPTPEPPQRPEPEYMLESALTSPRKEFIMDLPRQNCDALRNCKWHAVEARPITTQSQRRVWEIDVLCDRCGTIRTARALYPREVVIACGRRIDPAVAEVLGLPVKPAARRGWPTILKPWRWPLAALSLAWRVPTWPWRVMFRKASDPDESEIWAPLVILSIIVPLIVGIAWGIITFERNVSAERRAGRCQSPEWIDTITTLDRAGDYWVLRCAEHESMRFYVRDEALEPTLGGRGYRCGNGHWHALPAQGEDGDQ